jgi:hypothetical protein
MTPGSWISSVTLSGALRPFAFSTTKSTVLTSGSSKGTSALIWLGAANKIGAATSPNQTRVSEPGNSVGIATSIELYAVEPDRFVPKMVMSDPRAATGIDDELFWVVGLMSACTDGACANAGTHVRRISAKEKMQIRTGTFIVGRTEDRVSEVILSPSSFKRASIGVSMTPGFASLRTGGMMRKVHDVVNGKPQCFQRNTN